MFYLSENYVKKNEFFITFDRVNNHSIICSKRNAKKNMLLESWCGPKWVLTGKIALCLSIRRCRWFRIPIFKKFWGFCDKRCTAFVFNIIEKQHDILPRQCIFPYVQMAAAVTRRRRYRLCFPGRGDAQVTWCCPHWL